MAGLVVASIVGVLGNVISVLLFLSPIKEFSIILRRRTTGAYKSIIYVLLLLTASLWTFYGIFIKAGVVLVATVNGFGALLQLIYLSLFFKYAASPAIRACAITQFVIINVAVFGAVVLFSTLVLHGDDNDNKIKVVGLLGAVSNICTYASPLSALKTVIETGTVDSMPLWLSTCIFFNGGVWTLYALLVNDLFLGIPNAMGIVLGGFQMLVHAYYWWGRQSQDEIQENLLPN